MYLYHELVFYDRNGSAWDEKMMDEPPTLDGETEREAGRILSGQRNKGGPEVRVKDKAGSSKQSRSMILVVITHLMSTPIMPPMKNRSF